MGCDRIHVNVAKTQHGLLEKMFIPLFEVFTAYLESKEAKAVLHQLVFNEKKWKYKYDGRLRRGERQK